MRNNKKNKGIGDVVSDLGFTFEVFKAIAHAVMAKGGTLQDLRRIVKEPGLQQQIADLVVPGGLDITLERPLGEGEYLVQVAYTVLPSFTQLEYEFGRGNVSNLFDGCVFQKHALCMDADEIPDCKVFLVKRFDYADMSEPYIAEMDELGYRPATHVEAYAFARANPELQLRFDIVALGSMTNKEGPLQVAVLSRNSGRRLFAHQGFVCRWGSESFLFVRK